MTMLQNILYGGQFMNLTYQEVKKQYTALHQTFNYMLEHRHAIEELRQQVQPTSITFVGCGSSYCLSESAAFSTRLYTHMPASALAGGDLMLNAERYAPLLANTLLVAPSRSGSTSEIIEAIQRVRKLQPLSVLSLSCVSDSPLSTQADLSLELPWAFDHSVCQTRTVTNLYVANLLINAFWSNDEKLIEDIQSAIQMGEAYMEKVEASIREVADFAWERVILLADGELQGLANEGAIAITEIAQAEAHAFHLLDVRHGPMVTIDQDTLVIAALTGEGTSYQHDLIQDIHARGARIIALADHANRIPDALVHLGIVLEQPLHPAAQGIPFIFIPQIVALASAELQNINPDQPDGLEAWVKL